MAERSSFRIQPDTLNFNASIGSFEPFPPSSIQEMDHELEMLHNSKDQWISLSLEHKVKILDQVMEDFNQVAKQWVDLSMQSKGIPKDSFGEGRNGSISPSATA